MSINRNPGTGKIVFKRFTQSEIEDADAEGAGFCIACGEIAFGVEPDARKYTCESCDLDMVYGAEELAVMGLLKG